jgi:hypothetical protein
MHDAAINDVRGADQTVSSTWGKGLCVGEGRGVVEFHRLLGVGHQSSIVTL